MSDQPNFLFLITDQQRADWLGCYGHPVLKTPNIDSIASQGIQFNDFHVASPVCMPNRASLLTGRMPTLHGLRYNGCILSANANTFVDVLAKEGYDTAAIGKCHLQPFTGLPSWHAARSPKRLIEEAWKPDEREYSQEAPESFASTERFQVETPYYGFSHLDMVTGHGDRCGGHYGQWFRAKIAEWRELWDPANELPHNYTCPQAYRTPVPEELYPTAWVADRAIEYLTSQNRPGKSFFAFVSFPDPHHPFNPPGKYWDMYSPDDFELPIPYSAHKNPIPPMKWLEANFRGAGNQLTAQTAIYLDEQAIRESMALTAGMIACIDDNVGRIIEALKESGLFDRTVVIFNSDHGDYLGDYNLLLKGLLSTRGITRVPFMWSDPKDRRADTTDALASTIDLSATILDRAGLEPYYGIQGRSMLPTIEENADHRHELLIEFNDGAPKFGFAEPARVRTLLTRDWRYTLFADQAWGELYNIPADPKETNNLWDNSEFLTVRSKLSERLNHHLVRQMDESPCAKRLA